MTRRTDVGGRAVATFLTALLVLSALTIGLSAGVAASDASPASGNVTVAGDIDSSLTTLGSGDDPRVILKQSGTVVDSTFADSNGNFAFYNVADGSYTLVAKADGHRDASQSVSVSGSDVTGISFTLQGPVVNENAGASYTSIQTAVDNANTGDTITVAPGTYTESVTIDVDGLTLKSTAGATQTTITASGSPAIRIDGSQGGSTGVVIDGFQLTAGTSGNKVLNTYNMADLTVRDTIIRPLNDQTPGMYTDGTLTMDDVVFRSPYGKKTGLTLDGAGGSLIEDTRVVGWGNGIQISGSMDITISGSEVRNNAYTGINVDAGSSDVSPLTIDHTSIVGNPSDTGVNIYNSPTGTADATDNWWGDASGASSDTTGPVDTSSPLGSPAGTPKITGSVTLGASGSSISSYGQAEVRLLQGGAVVTSTLVNGSGMYEFRNVSDGTYTVVADASGHREASTTVSVSGSDKTASFTLDGAVKNVDTGNSFTTISAAINSGSVSAGNTITVAPGTYDEYLDAWGATDLTIESTGAATETVLTGQGQGNTPTINAGSSADGLTVDGLTLQASGNPSIVFNTYSMSTLGLQNSIVEATGSMTGVRAGGTATIVDNEIVSTTPDGIGINLPSTATGSTITDNEITGFGSGIKVTDADSLTISRNQIANNGDASGEDAINIDVTSGTTIDGSTISITQNNIVSNNWGLSTGGAGTVANEVDAEKNWWGSVDGPGTNGANGVSGAVDYSPWLDAAAPDGVAVSTAISLTAADPVPNTEGQSATYRTNVTFDQVGTKDAVYISVGFGNDTVDFSGVSANDVTLEDPSGTTLSIDNVQTVNATTLLVKPTNAIADPDLSSTYDLALENVTNPSSGTYNLTVGLHESGSAVNGNASVSFAGSVDSYSVSTSSPPSISNFDASNPSGQDVQVSFDSDKPLSDIEVALSGAESTTLTTSDFSETDNGDGTYTYTATYAGSTDGDYTATLETAADSFGNDGASGESDTVTVSTVVGVGISPETTSVEGGQTTTVDLVVTEAETGVGGFDLSIKLTDDRRADITAVDIATDSAGNEADGKSISIAEDGSSADISATYLGDTISAGSPTVATVTLEGIATGPTNLTYTATSVTDSNGMEYGITGTNETELTITDTTAPTADAGSDKSIDEDTSVEFDGSASSDNVGIASYEWDFGDGSTATGRTPSHTFAEPGTYTVTLTTTDGAGQTDSDTLSVTVADTTAPTPEAGPNQTVDVGASVSFDGTGSSDNVGIASYQWDFGDGTTGTGPTPSHAYSSPGTYTVTLTVTDDAGNTATDTMTVTVSDTTAPTADAGSNQTTALGSAASFDGTGSSDNVGIASYEWDFGDGTTGTGPTPSHEYDEPGIYTVTLTVTDEYGNTDTDTLTVTVEDRAPPTAEAGSDKTVSTGVSVGFDGTASSDNVAIGYYQWNFGDGTTVTDPTPTHTFEEPGTYTVRLTVTDRAGNTDTDTITVTVEESTGDTTPPTAEAGPDQTVAVGSTVDFDGSESSDNAGIASYQWDFGDGTSATGVSPEHTYTSTGTYTVTLTVTDSAGNTATDTMTVTVEESVDDTTAPTAEAGPNVTTDIGSTVEFDGSASSDDVSIASYQWDFGDGTTGTGITVSHSYAKPGTYTATLTVTDQAGNTDTDTLTVTVEDETAPTADAGQNLTVEAGETVELDASDSSDNVGIDAYEWGLGDGSTATGEVTTHSFEEPGTYTVSLTVIDQAGNTDTDTITVDVKPADGPGETPGPTTTSPPDDASTTTSSPDDSTTTPGETPGAGTTDDGAVTTTPSGSGPGFTAVLTLLALALGSLVALRREH